MPDYASILKRSIETLPEKTPDMRQAVYERARTALARQLTAVDPPLSAELIESQHQHLEAAISAAEADFSPAAAGAGETPETATGNGQNPGDTAPPGDDVPANLPAAESEPPAAPEAEEAAPPAMAEIEPEPSNKRWEQPKASRAPALIMLLLFALIAAPVAFFAYTQWETVQAVIEDFTGERTIAEAPAGGPQGGDVARPEAAGGELGDAAKLEDRLLDGAVAPLDGEQATQPVAGAPDAAAVDDGLNEPIDEIPRTGDSGNTQTAGVTETPAAELPVSDAPAAPVPTATETGANETSAGETAALETPTGTETVDAVPQGLVGQRAIYEEQGVEGAPGTSVPGVVAWTQKTKENSLPAIVGMIELPSRNAMATITITKNVDEALPASHLIEIEFRGADGLVESPLERVPALLLKRTAQARGTPLTGEAVPVTENLYWIALSDQGDQVSRNLALLREGAWLTLPIQFKNGRNALLNFEKGIPGDQVFEAVLAAWEKADAGQ